MAPPPFGGFDPNSGARVGFGFGGGGVRGQFSLYAAQGSSRSISGTSGVLTLPNGGFGTVIDSTYRPFITQITPVLGESSVAKILREHGVPRIPYRAEEPPQSVQDDTSPASQIKTARSTSSAEQGAASLSEIRRQLAAEDAAREAEFQQILDEAQALETQGDFKGAASVYARAAMRKEGSEQDKLLQYSRSLRKK
jgi:hypothetical protein